MQYILTKFSLLVAHFAQGVEMTVNSDLGKMSDVSKTQNY